ncbi:MAG TPA: TAL effector repeat-containing protein [Burkholderiaceae bacterium]|nr:TAL effector repeat-containing protein [Burkholderiaceae bacterium]
MCYLRDNALALMDTGLSEKEILAIASNDGGSQALDKVLLTHQKLKDAGFTDPQIVAIASNNGGSQALDKVLLTHQKLKDAGFTDPQIVAIASNIGGAQALDKVLLTHVQFRKAGFTPGDIVEMADHNGGAPALQAVLDHLGLLQTRYSNDEIVKAGAKRRGAAGHVKQMAEAIRIKQEGASSSALRPRTVLVERAIDQARTAFIPQLPRCDLTSGQPIWSLDEDGATIVRHPMEPVEANNHKFPLRDLTAPLSRVHQRYATEDGKCHPNVKLRGIELAKGYKTYFNRLCRDPRVGLLPKQVAEVRERLLDNARAEFERLIREESTDAWPCEPRRLDRNEVPLHERMLADQYGLFLKSGYAAEQQPVLSNGRILGFYMGVFAASDQDIETLEAQHPDYVRYSLDAPRPGGKLTVYSAQGCANDLAFANTALLPHTAQPTYDRERLNAEFVPFEVRLTDKNGKPARETVIAVVALNNAIGKELRIDYGDAFLQQFKSDSGQPASSQQAPAAKVEADDEMPSPPADAGPSSSADTSSVRLLDLNLPAGMDDAPD